MKLRKILELKGIFFLVECASLWACARGLSLKELFEVRVDFIADCDWAVLEKAKNAFQKRVIVSHKCHEYDEAVLWNSFELFEQLHIMKLLDGFAQTMDNFQNLTVIFY